MGERKKSFEEFMDEVNAPFFARKVVQIHKKRHLCKSCLRKLFEGYYGRR